jgi:eukaryotic-like serine/threonine-protein kinase
MSGNGSVPTAALGPGYEAIELLSRGNDFDVYDAWSYERGCRVIVKTVLDEHLDDPRTRTRLLREGRLLLRLTHPHIVRGYEVLPGPPRPVVVMETLGGQTVAHMIDADGPLADGDAAQLGLQIGSAIRCIHAHDYLHLDLRPSNVIDEGGRAKLIDLGLVEAPGPITAGVGTWCYLAPEQALGGWVGEATDVWGLGALLFEALAGFPPFDDPEREIEGLMDEEIEYPQLERRPRPLAEVSSAGRELIALVEACLHPRPSGRPGLASLLGRLERVAETS